MAVRSEDLALSRHEDADADPTTEGKPRAAARAGRPGPGVVRFGVSLPEDVAAGLDRMVVERKMPSRSHAIAHVVRQELLRHDVATGATTLAGVITLVYRDTAHGARSKLGEIQRRHLRAIISSQHVFLEDDRSLEVLLVQGPREVLRTLRDELSACRLVEQVELTASRTVLPPLY